MGRQFKSYIHYVFTLSIILCTPVAFAVTIHVPTDYSTIQAAIDAASNGDTVVVANGTYTGEGNKDLDFKGKAITVISENGPDYTIIDCEDEGRGFWIRSGEGKNSVLSGFTITKGKTDFGGGIACVNSSPTITNCIVTENYVQSYTPYDGLGGGIYCNASSPAINDCIIIRNFSAQGGGGIACENSSSPNIVDSSILENSSFGYGGMGVFSRDSSPSFIHCTIQDNYRTSTSGYGGGFYCIDSNTVITSCVISGHRVGMGGGVYCEGGSLAIADSRITENNGIDIPNYGGGIYCSRTDAEITKCIIDRNSAGGGGGIYFDDSSINVSQCIITGNVSSRISSSGDGGGGGILCHISTGSITECHIVQNSAISGGGISSDGSSPNIINCSVTQNSASRSGGGIYLIYSSPIINNCTIAGNWADDGGGLSSDYSSHPTVTNNIFWANTPDEISSYSTDLILTYSIVRGGWPGVGNLDANPAFLDQANGDFHLRAYSPCIGAGTPTGATNSDLDGKSRPNPPGSSPDMGAYEHSRAIRVAPPLNVFATEVGNRWTYEGTQQGNLATVEREIIRLDQTTSPVDTYVHEIKTNGYLGQSESYEKRPNELRLWESGGYQFSSGLLAFWYPAQVVDHRESSANVIGYSGSSVRLTVDIISNGPLALTFDTLEAYEMRYQFEASGPGGTETDIFRWWVVPYIGVVKDEREDSLGELTSFAIGGGTITQDTDADNDNLKDYQELLIYDTDWLEADTDFDGLRDGEEIHSYNADPIDWDTDGDGMADGWEVEYNLNYFLNDANEDSDDDGFTNVQEYRLNSDPQDPESYPDDVDVVWDFDEDEVIDYFDNCLYVYNPGQEDSDGDGCGDACDGRPDDPNWLTISSSITYDSTPLCAMVLANGQYMFTCSDYLGLYELDVPLDEHGEITLYGFCSGFSPFKVLLTPTQARNFDINMARAAVGSREIETTMQTEPGTDNQDYIRVSGTVTYDGQDLCAMVLINGQSMFSCGGDLGTFDLEVPLDENGEITLYCFCSGFAPYKDVFTP